MASTQLPRFWWWGFALYAVISAVHIIGKLVPDWAFDNATKLMLIPALAVAVLWAARGQRNPVSVRTFTLLFIALAFSWLGDGAGTFFPALPELPVMLACFGVTHLLYIWMFWKRLALRRLPAWSAVYGLWWVALLVVLWPSLGSLAVPVAVYGLVLGGTAVAATRCTPLITWGAVFFLASDSILAIRLFLTELNSGWMSPVIMLTYCLGQGLIALGIVRAIASSVPVLTPASHSAD